MIGSPHSQNEAKEKGQESMGTQANVPKLMMISSCGFPDRDEFQVISLWIKKVAQKMNMELVGEIYATQGKYLASPPDDLMPFVSDYLLLLEEAGREIASEMKLSDKTEKRLLQNFLP